MILVIGATGILGMQICRILSENSKNFRTMVRVSSDQWKVDQLRMMGGDIFVGDLKYPISLAKACEGITQVISTASSIVTQQEGDNIQTVDHDGQINLVKAAREAGVKKFVFISFTDHPDIDYPLNKAKRDVETALNESGMNWTSLWTSYFMESWLSPALGFDYANATARIYGTGERKISWISFRDVAKFAVHALYSPAADNAIIQVGGPHQLSPKEVVKIFEEVQGRKFKIDYVPVEVLRQQKEKTQDPLQNSFAGLMLKYAAGDRVDMRSILGKIHVEMTSVKEYARQMSTVSA
jgi:NADH dehydrogenase